ncbi:MAG: YhgE/Pip family protein [Lachnospiraceae bacterium]
MVKNELKALWNNKLLMVVLLVIILIPAMYAGFFLASMWDPYGDLSYLPVAVVNNDEAVTYNGKKLRIGDDFADNLAENDAMAFNVVDEKTAKTGLENGTYYMVITIPENFSKNASTLMDDHPQKMVIHYETNPGKNYISMKLSESAMKEIKSNLTEEVTHTYAETVFDSLKDVEDGFQDAVDGTLEMIDGENDLLEGNQKITDNLDALSSGASELKTGTDTLASGSHLLKSKMPAVTSGASALADGAGQVRDGVNELAKGLSGMTNTISDNIATQTRSQMELTEKVENDKATVNGSVMNYATALTGSVAKASAGTAAQYAGMAGATVAAEVAGTAAGTTAAGATLSAVNNNLPTIIAQYYAAYAAIPGMTGTAEEFSQFLQGKMQIPAGDSSSVTPVIQQAVQTAMEQNNDNISAAIKASLADGSAGSVAVSEAAATAAQTVSTKDITNSVTDLANDAGQLGGATGALQVLNTMNESTNLSQLPTLVNGAKAVADGAVTLVDGTKQVSDAVDQIATGSSRLSDGASKIADGSIQLSDGSRQLGEGLYTLKDGTKTLQNGLSEGKEEIAKHEASDATLDMFAKPVELEETKITEVENNGHAMAAYMFSVGIWVACLAFCLMYPLARYTGELTNGKDWWASKAVILYPMAGFMVIMLFVILHFALGFTPASWLKTVFVAFATVSCFMAIMYFFNLLLGKVGSFLMLLFMVLQLAGSAGTYPVEISGKLAQSLNKWMPFTYSVNGFRAGIAENGPSVVKECVILFCISIVFTLLTIGVFRIRSLRTKQGKPFLYDWLEEKGLA